MPYRSSVTASEPVAATCLSWIRFLQLQRGKAVYFHNAANKDIICQGEHSRQSVDLLELLQLKFSKITS